MTADGSSVEPTATERTHARPTKPRRSPLTYLVVVGLVLWTWFTARQVGFNWSTFVDLWTNPLWEKFWPIPWEWVFDRRNVIDPLIETFQIAVVATVVGCGLALPVSFARSRLTSLNAGTYWVTRVVMNIVRAVPDLFWAKILVTAIGSCPFPGTWALSIDSLEVMVKLFFDTIHGADPRPF